MNVILVTSDTLRRDHLGCYGNDWIHTPNLDRLAAESFVFDRAYAASFPTVPNRLDVLTGRYTCTNLRWQPLPPNEVTIPQVLGAAGYTSMMIVDTPHIMQAGFHFDRGFSGWEWIRGQENDRWRTWPRDPALPAAPEKLREPEHTVKQHLRNTAVRRGEQDCFCAQTMRTAAAWLEENRMLDRFFLYVDTFDPHEPWDAPQHYVDLYDPGYEGDEVFYPRYGPADYLTKAELKHLRALYAAEVTLVDRWVGHLLRRVEELGLLDSTALVFTTDHGFYHGEHGLTGKSIIWSGGYASCPLYEEVAHIPLLIRLPGQTKGRRIAAYAQPPDLLPTIVALTGADHPGTMNGHSLLPLMEAKGRPVRRLCITTPSLAHSPNTGEPTTITMGEWSLIYSGDPAGDGERHVTRAVDGIARAAGAADGPPVSTRPELYHLPTDPGQRRNVIRKHPEVARKLHAAHLRMLEELGMEEQFLRHRRTL